MIDTRPIYQRIAGALVARQNCIKSHNLEWEAKHKDTAHQLAYDYMPSGSGIDHGTHLDLDKSTGEKLVFHTAFHHMDENGTYDGWTEHTITVKPSLTWDITIRISGRNRHDIKEYMREVFDTALRAHGSILDPLPPTEGEGVVEHTAELAE